MDIDPTLPLIVYDNDLTLSDYRGERAGDHYVNGGYDLYRLIALELQQQDGSIEEPSDHELDQVHLRAQETLDYPTQRDIFGLLFPGYEDVAAAIWEEGDYSYAAVPGAPETVQTLRERGYPQAIASDHREAHVQKSLKGAGYDREEFLFILHTDDDGPRKPDKRFFTRLVAGGIEEANRTYGTDCSLRRVVYVGDHPKDYIAAERARREVGGPTALIAPSGFFPRDRIIQFPERFRVDAEDIVGVPAGQVLPHITGLPDWLDTHGYAT